MERISIFAFILLLTLAGNIMGNKGEILDEAMKMVEIEQLEIMEAAKQEQPLKGCARPGENCLYVPCCYISGHEISCEGDYCFDWTEHYPPMLLH